MAETTLKEMPTSELFRLLRNNLRVLLGVVLTLPTGKAEKYACDGIAIANIIEDRSQSTEPQSNPER